MFIRKLVVSDHERKTESIWQRDMVSQKKAEWAEKHNMCGLSVCRGADPRASGQDGHRILVHRATDHGTAGQGMHRIPVCREAGHRTVKYSVHEISVNIGEAERHMHSGSGRD